jgi:tetratricopeptide (TPR) repeat protein
MSRRYFNWKLAIVLILTIVAIGVTAVGLHRWQKTNSAERGLVLGNKAYEEQDWEVAAKQLGLYITMHQDDVPVLLKYADAQMHIRPLKSNNIQHASTSYRIILRKEDHPQAALKLTEIYLLTGLPGEAELIAKRQLEKAPDPNLRRMLARALAQQRKFNEAEAELKTICTEHPDQVQAYEALGQLIEQYPDQFSDQAKTWFDKAIQNNPSSALAYLARASFYLRNKEQSKALMDINTAERLDLSDTSVRLRLAGELISLNLLDRAQQHLEEINKTDSSNQNLWQLWAQLALQSQSPDKMTEIAETGLKELASQPWDFLPVATELFIRSGKLERAAECISKLRQKDIPSSVVTNLEALMAVEKGNYYEAVKYWKQSVESGNKSIQTQLNLAAALSQIGDRQSALRQLEMLLSERPDSYETHLALAKMFAQSADWARAREHAAKAVELAPGNPGPAILNLQVQIQSLSESPTNENSTRSQEIEKQLTSLGKTLSGNIEPSLLQLQLMMQQGNYTSAQDLINHLKKEYPSRSVSLALAEAELLVAQDKTSDAISELNQTITKYPDEIGPVRYLAVLLYRQGDQNGCIAVLKNAMGRIEEYSTRRELGLMLTQLYMRWGQTDNAYKQLDALSQMMPNDIPIKRQLLSCDQIAKNPEKAQQIVNQIKTLEGEDGWQWRYEQAKLWSTADNFKENYPRIVSLLQKNLLTNPDDQQSRTLLARTYEKGGEIQLAISTYREALNKSPEDLRIITSYVAALYRAEEYDQANKLLEQASKQKLQNSDLQKLRLQNYLRLGHIDSASDILQDLVRNDPNNHNTILALALLEIQQNEFEQAGQLLAKLKSQDPNSLVVTAAQIQFYLRQDKSREALEISDEMVNKLHNASAYILRARTYATVGQLDKALEDLGQAINLDPKNVEVWIARSDFYRSTGHITEAVADIRQALSLTPKDVQIQKRAISLFLTSGQPETIHEGDVLLDKILESNPQDLDLQLFKANALLAEGTTPALENARQILQKITNDQPQVDQAWLLLGELMLRQGQPGLAADVAMRGLAYKPEDKSLMLLKARAEAVRSPVLAVPTLKQLCELDPNDINAVMLLADTYMKINEPQKAVSILRQQLLTCEPSFRQKCRTVLAVALYKSGDKSQAQEEFKALEKSEPNNPSPILAQAKLFREEQLWNPLKQLVTDWIQKHPSDKQTPFAITRELITVDNPEAKQLAENILRLILQNNPASVEAMSLLAIVMEMTGHSTESAELYQKLLELNPKNLIAINNLAWILCERQQQYQQALELANKGLKLAPDYLDLIETRGVIYYHLGEFNKAVEELTKCIKLYPESSPSSVAAKFHLARVLAELGQKSEALKYTKQALELEDKIKGLSPEELTEAKSLLNKLEEGR